MRRAAAFTVAYVAAALLPAAIAITADPVTWARPARVEAAAALGFFAFALILLEFALVSRLRVVSRVAGTDVLLQLHQWVGLGAVVMSVLHPWLLGTAWREWLGLSGPAGLRAGALALWALAALAATTLLRRLLGISYEYWRLLHVAFATAAAGLMTAHILLTGQYQAAPPVRTIIAAYVVAFGVVVAAYRLWRPWHLRSRPWVIVSNRDEGASTRTLRVRPDGHPGFSFAAGQFAWLVTGRSPFSAQQHPLSISSSAERPADGAIEFSIKALGDWSATAVPALAPGTRIWVDGPFGAFTPPAHARRLLLIAGGIGIAPCRSILLTMRERGDRTPVHLLYAGNDPSRVIFTSELEALAQVLPLDVRYVFEHPPDTWTGERGFITADTILRTVGAHLRECHCLICGPSPMLKSIDRHLRAIGVPTARIHSERFHVV